MIGHIIGQTNRMDAQSKYKGTGADINAPDYQCGIMMPLAEE